MELTKKNRANVKHNDFQKEAGRALTALYATEINFRLEALQGKGFILSFAGLRVEYDYFCQSSEIDNIFEYISNASNKISLPRFDWDERFYGETLEELIQNVAQHMIAMHPNSLFVDWLYGDTKYLQEPLTEKEEHFADKIEKLFTDKIPFRIETQLFSGFTTVFINDKIQPSRVEVDEKNITLEKEGVNENQFLEVPEVDWIKRIADEPDLVEAVNMLIDYVDKWTLKNK